MHFSIGSCVGTGPMVKVRFWNWNVHPTFGTFLEVCIRFFFHLCRIFMRKASWNHCSSSRNFWTVTKRIDSSCSVRCHALHDCHQTWSFQQAPSSKLINMRCGWALPSQCVGSTQLECHYTPPRPPTPTPRVT